MNYARKELIFFITFTAIGAVALLAALFGHIPDSYRAGLISGIAGGFTLTGVLGIISSIRLLNDPDRATKIELAKTFGSSVTMLKSIELVFLLTFHRWLCW